MRTLYITSLILMLLFGGGSLILDLFKLFNSELNLVLKMTILIVGLVISIGATMVIFSKLYENLLQSRAFKSLEEFKSILGDPTQVFALITFLSLFSGGLFRLVLFTFLDSFFLNLFGVVLILLSLILAFINSVYLKFINQFKKEALDEC